MFRKNRLFIGTVEDLFRDSDSDRYDEDDVYLNLAAEKCEKKNKVNLDMNDEDDVYLVQKYERQLERVPNSMLHLLRESKKNIKKKHLPAKVRLIQKKIGKE